LPETPEALTPAPLAPVWHTVALVAGIVAISVHGAAHFSGAHGPINRLVTYGFTAAMELSLLGWVTLGLRLRKIPLRSLLGSFSFSLRSIAADVGIALLFWFGSLMVLGTLSVAWAGLEAAVTHRPPVLSTGHTLTTDPAQQQALRTLVQLAPSNAKEIAGWMLLCLLVGVVEEIVFRGYLQRQFIAWARGGVAPGVLFSALLFGAAHGYQGMRSMVLLAVFGVLFSLLALARRSLRPGIFAHSWHDLIAGLTLALLKSHGLI
jgi:hypothetical protein